MFGIHGLNEELGRQLDIEVDKVSVCVICSVMTVKVWVTFCEIALFILSSRHYF